MADQFILSMPIVVDSNGNTVTGTIDLYQTGTTTPAVGLFTDEALTTAIANPLTLTAGVWPQVFGTPAYAIRAVIKDGDGVTLYDIDPISRTTSASGAAATVTITPTANQPETNVEDAVNNLADTTAGKVSAASPEITGIIELDGTVPTIDVTDTSSAAGGAMHNALRGFYANGTIAMTLGHADTINLLVRSEREDLIFDADFQNVTASSEILFRVDGGTTVVQVDSGGQTVTGDSSTTGQVLLANGSAAAPSMAFTGDTDLGFFLSSAGVLGVSASGARQYIFTTADHLTADESIVTRERLDALCFYTGAATLERGDVTAGTNLTRSCTDATGAPFSSASSESGTWMCTAYAEQNRISTFVQVAE